MDDDERKDKTRSNVSTIECLRQGNINILTQKTDKRRKKKKAVKN